MIDRRLLQLIPETRKLVALNVLMQWVALMANVVIISTICMLIASLFEGTVDDDMMIGTAIIAMTAIVIRGFCVFGSSRLSYHAGIKVKRKLREEIFSKLIRLGIGYRDSTTTAEAIQISVEGVDQLENYYGKYLPQLFYAIVTPITLLVIISRYNIECAVILFIFVPIIPLVIIFIQMWAKGVFKEYWGRYAEIGNMFLESLQGMTDLKIYGSDERRNDEMNARSEEFHETSMRSLKIQLGSITLMDLAAYGGSAIGITMGILMLQQGSISLEGCLAIILLSIEFFLPMRELGSYIHIAMKGMSASERLFALLDLPEPDRKGCMFPINVDIEISDVSFSYGDRKVVDDVSMDLGINTLTSIVGESGCGKSTMASVIMGRNRDYEGKILIGGTELREINEDSVMRNITYVDSRSYLFKGTIRENLMMGSPDCSEATVWETLSDLEMETFVREVGGLDTEVCEGGSNLSGGQRQRLAIARAILHDSPIYIFDECTSNIDAESERIIIRRICELSRYKIVILVSHRLANVVDSGTIHVMEKGRIVESGKHEELLEKHGAYERMWNAQRELESYGVRGDAQ